MSARIRTRLGAALAVAIAAGGLIGCASGPQLPATVTLAEGSVEATFEPIADIPIPAGSRLDVERSLILGVLDRWTGRVVLNIGLSVGKAFALYQQQMPTFGWQPIASAQAEVSFLTFTRGDRVATVQIERRTLGGSTVTVTVAPRNPDRAPTVQAVPLGN